jgi:transcriptional regulator with XRE-family HTH domain
MKLSEKRLAAGLKQKEVMKDVGLYSKIESGKALAVEKDCNKFAELFDCELTDLFEESELLFFERLLKLDKGALEEGKEFAVEEPKIVTSPVCKSAKKHIELTRKCYWLNHTRSEKLKHIIHQQGFKSEQEWFSYMVDLEIEKAACSTAMETSGKENIAPQL